MTGGGREREGKRGRGKGRGREVVRGARYPRVRVQTAMGWEAGHGREGALKARRYPAEALGSRLYKGNT